MLDTETKRRIDSARDILVGKVPDPKSQVEQITIALIYKFMDDMDADTEELGGKRSFFTGKFSRFGWRQLMDPALSGQEKLDRYAEGIQKMTQNEKLPQLFRDIFKNAYLPYRDPETLRGFLKIIDEFTYDHSERLGDAFEYLLSVLGSQGDAGQFRTPRHIIDFMVEIIAPQKDEIILDPACGTAGFLIAAYKHIAAHNRDADGNSTLTPDDRAAMAENLIGYDISPDMVRLSLVNLYLHGFTDPHVSEYDTLTSQDRWNEFADVILANPPFMSPKGGIKPHNRFSVTSNRSEVLFVNYMAEHLTAKGRASIVVPEGIIFQSQNAYKSLRKTLVEECLVAVISLPAGVFQPYSGVKTSILIFDKALAARAATLGFFKVENDGFSLGAQRTAVEGSQLPAILQEVHTYLQTLRDGTAATPPTEPSSKSPKKKSLPSTPSKPSTPSTAEAPAARPTHHGLIVPKATVAASGDYNLSGERYREGDKSPQKYEVVKLSDICKPQYGFTAKACDSGDVRFIRITDIGGDGFLKESDAKYIILNADSEKYLLSKGDVLVARTGATYGKTMIFDSQEPSVFASFLIRLRFPTNRLIPKFYWAFAQTSKYWDQAKLLVSGGGQPQFNGNALAKIQIPLPPLEVQQAIVAEIEGYQKVIDGARAVLDHYRPHIPIDPDWPVVELGELADFKNGLNFNKSSQGQTLKIVGVSDFQHNLIAPLETLSEVTVEGSVAESYLLKENDIVFVRSNGNPELVGRSMIIPTPLEPTSFSGFTIRGRITDQRADPIYCAHFFKSRDFADHMKTVGQGANIRNLSQTILNGLPIPLPPLETQRAIVAEIEAEQALVEANRELITRMEGKIDAAIARVWGDDTDVGDAEFASNAASEPKAPPVVEAALPETSVEKTSAQPELFPNG